MQIKRLSLALALVAGLVAIATISLSNLSLGVENAYAAPAAAPMQQGVTASGYVTTGSGTCFPDAVLTDCNGTVIHQLKGPAGAGFFQPYLGQWVEVNGAEQTCAAGDNFLTVVSISPETDPCPGGGGAQQPTATTVPPGQATAVPTAVQPGVPVTGNLAVSATIHASTSQAGFPPENAIDNNTGTHWASEAGRDPWRAAQNVQWIYIDFGAPQQINTMRIHWASQKHARTYGVYIWDNTWQSWRQIGSTNRGSGDMDEWTVAQNGSFTAQQVMLYLVNPYVMGPMGNNYEINEWEFFGTGAAPGGGAAANSALNAAATALNEEAGFPAANATDGNDGTEWHSSGGLPTWFYVDLGTEKNINRAALKWANGMHATNYSLSSWDGRQWRAFHSQRNGQGGDENVNFWTVRTRYVMLYANTGPNANIGLREFEVFEPNSSGGGGGGGAPNPPAPPIPFAEQLMLDGQAEGIGAEPMNQKLPVQPLVVPEGMSLSVLPEQAERFGSDTGFGLSLDMLELPMPGAGQSTN